MLIDCHTHIGGLGFGGTGCRISEPTLRRISFRLMIRKLGLTAEDLATRADQRIRELCDRHLSTAREVTHMVLFAHDWIHDDAGRPLKRRSQLHTPNDYVLKIAAADPRVLVAASIHPYRPDALDELTRCLEAGAVALKWLPNSQNIDPGDRRCRPLYRLMAERGIPLIAHTGGELTVTVLSRRLSDPRSLIAPLEEGVPVIAAHCGGNSLFDTDHVRVFARMARKWPNLYGDTAALCCSPIRARTLAYVLREEGLLPRLIHGSDYPIPATPWSLIGRVPFGRLWELNKVANPLDLDVALKRAAGVPQQVFDNGNRLFGRRLKGAAS
jgi:hypothetical protein